MTNTLRKLSDLKIKSKIVVVRANLDVPMQNGVITDNSRLKASIPTLKFLSDNNCKIILIGHLGRPEGKYVDELSLMPVRFELGKLLGKQIKFANISSCENSVKFMSNGEVLMLENLRFDPKEESENPKERLDYVKKLSEFASLYVNDCFGVYKENASVYELAKIMPSVAGFALSDEIEKLQELRKPAKPYVAIIGGAKLDSKVPIIEDLIGKVDTFLIGGAMAYSFLSAKGVDVGNSKTDKESVKIAKEILKKAKGKSEILLPIDHVVVEELNESAEKEITKDEKIKKNEIGVDIGPKTIELFEKEIVNASSILWNGPMGVFEWENFNDGTRAIGNIITNIAPKESYKVAGGGDTVFAIQKLKIKPSRFNHISMGGGMMLQFLTGEDFKVLDILKGEQKIKKL